VIINSSLVVSSAKIEEKVKIERAVIGPDCIIKKGAKVVNSVLLKGVIIEAEYNNKFM
jgi:NDP-sugar pyrophosphorylase family protein